MNSYVNRNIYDKCIKRNKKFLPRHNIGKLHPGVEIEKGLSLKEWKSEEQLIFYSNNKAQR